MGEAVFKGYVMKNKNGFTLIEVILVIMIIGLLVSVLLPAYFLTIKKAEQALCLSFRKHVQLKVFEFELQSNKAISETDFTKTLIELKLECPEGGRYTLDINGEIQCSEHSEEELTSVDYLVKDWMIYST